MSSRRRGTSAARFSGAPRIGDRNSTCGQPLETLLENVDPSASGLARAALGWILPEGAALTHLGQIELQVPVVPAAVEVARRDRRAA